MATSEIPPDLDGYTLATSASLFGGPVTVRVFKDGWFRYFPQSFVEELIEEDDFGPVMDAMFADMKEQEGAS